ncbi:hypothetical protein JQX13_46545 [Archangium violaceum]|uniref:hypothetical protein n=1 Tax=Archangium violaceum TaxID=83451 RepID=UPI00193B1903|nr:hypothetical protein [Archangium violaceum]QRK07405.1 hypothetical protein JQX13_46545 [Archangium violaceum]
MANEPPRLIELPSPPRLPLLEDPDHPGVFVVKRIGMLTALLVGGLCTALLLAGSFVRLDVPVQAEGATRMESMTLGAYVARQLGLWTPLGSEGAAP